jgi:hemin uptake protein HemP
MPQIASPAGTEMQTTMPSPVHQPTESGRFTGGTVVVPAEYLFKGAQEIRIQHNGDLYCLRITRNDKLILTK